LRSRTGGHSEIHLAADTDHEYTYILYMLANVSSFRPKSIYLLLFLINKYIVYNKVSNGNIIS